jgi:hypothetical protein
MARLEELTRGASVKGVLPNGLVIDIKWHGTGTLELTYKDAAGKPGIELLFRDREPLSIRTLFANSNMLYANGCVRHALRLQ